MFRTMFLIPTPTNRYTYCQIHYTKEHFILEENCFLTNKRILHECRNLEGCLNSRFDTFSKNDLKFLILLSKIAKIHTWNNPVRKFFKFLIKNILVRETQLSRFSSRVPRVCTIVQDLAKNSREKLTKVNENKQKPTPTTA